MERNVDIPVPVDVIISEWMVGIFSTPMGLHLTRIALRAISCSTKM